LFFAFLKYKFNLGGSDNLIAHYLNYYPNKISLVFFTDTLNFVLRNLTLIFTWDYFATPNAGPGFLIVLQSWTLQVELLFYLLVPFIFRLNRKMFYLLTLAYVAIFFGIILRFNLVPQFSLTYFFFLYFLYFLVGMMSYSLYQKIQNIKISKKIFVPIFTLFIIYLLCYDLIPYKINSTFFGVENLAYYVVFFAIVPFAFMLTKNSGFDKILGELSYPIYITHLFFIKLLSNIHINNTIVSLIVTVLFSLLVIKFFINPIDNLRQKRLK
jgi:peptidoglycan/LPS O-acetylase OafA/YrhL